jgi:hypothetical protein
MGGQASQQLVDGVRLRQKSEALHKQRPHAVRDALAGCVKHLEIGPAAERLMGPPVNQDEESFDASSRPETVTASLPECSTGMSVVSVIPREDGIEDRPFDCPLLPSR